MNVEGLLARVESEPALRAHRDWFLRLCRPALSLHFVEAPAGHRGATRFGGGPDLPLQTEWPRHRVGPYRFLGQFDLGDLAPFVSTMDLPWRELLPRAGMLSLFVGDDPTGEMDPKAEMFWGDPEYAIALYAPPGTELVTASTPGIVDFNEAPVGVRFEHAVDVPQDKEQANAGPLAPSIDERARDAYSSLRTSCHTINHAFGYPTHQTLGYDPTPKGMFPLLSLWSEDERGWQWHDGDFLQLFVAPGAFPRDATEPVWVALRSDAG